MTTTERSEVKNVPLLSGEDRSNFVEWATSVPDGSISAGWQSLHPHLEGKRDDEWVRKMSALEESHAPDVGGLPGRTSVPDPDLLYESFLGIMRFERGLWETTLNVFLKNPTNTKTSGLSRGNLIQQTARSLFSYLEQSCSITVLTGISSLLLDKVYYDKKQTKPNLVLRRVIDELIPNGTAERSEIEIEYNKAAPLAARLNDPRDKLLAHNDLSWNLEVLEHDLKGTPYPGTPLNVGEVEQIMLSLVRITDLIVDYRRPGSSWYWDEPEIDRFFETLTKGLGFPTKLGE